MVNKNKIAYGKKTLPEYIDDTGKAIFDNKEWEKDPLMENVTINKDYMHLYLQFIISKNYQKWRDNVGTDQWGQFEHDFLPELLTGNINSGENSIYQQIIDFLRQPNNYQIQVENFQTQYKKDAKLKLLPSTRGISMIIPKQSRQSVIFKTKVKSLLYHFNNIRLGDFAFAIFDKYMKISPHYKSILDIYKTDEYILLSDNIIEFYISQCDTGLLVEFNFNYYSEIESDNKPKCNFIDRPKNVINKDKILKKIGQILQIKEYESLKEDYTQASFHVECPNINKSVWAYLAMNDIIFSKYITIPEFRISKQNNRFFFKFFDKISTTVSCKSYLELGNKKGNFGQITAKYLNISENLIKIDISRSLGKKSILKFQKKFLSLIDYYFANVNRIIALYKKNYNIQINQKIKKKKSLKKTKLKNLYPGYFNIGYSTNCKRSNQPAVVSKKEIETAIQKGLHIDYILKSPQSKKDTELIKKGKYPSLTPYTNSQGFESLYFLCNKKNSHGYIPSKTKNPYPRLNKNGCPCCMSNKKISPQSKSKGSSYTTGNAICTRICALPILLKNIFFILDPMYEYHRQSATPDILKLLNAIFRKKITKRDISEYEFLGITKQENWDIDNIKEYITEQKFIDPTRFIRILEEIYDCKLFILHRKYQVSRDTLDSREVPTLLTPRYNRYTNYYSWNKSDKRVVILFSHFGTKANIISEPYYELVTQTEWGKTNPTNMFNSKQDIVVSLYKFENMINESYCLNKELEPFNPINFENAIQIIDYYGKCRGIIIDKLSLLFDPIPPLNLPYKKLKDVKYDTLKKVLEKCKKLGIKIDKKSDVLLKGVYKDITVRIPIKVDNDNKFDVTRINAKYIIAWTFYLFSKYWNTNSPDIDKFLKKYIKVKSNTLTTFDNIIFKKDIESLTVPNKECVRNLRFVLIREYHYRKELLREYHHNNIIPDFYNEIRDFDSHSNELILYIDNIVKDLNTNFFTRFPDEQLDTMIPYFVSTNNKLWIYQNCQTEDVKKSIEKTWNKGNGFNNVSIIESSDTKFLAKLKLKIKN